MTEVGTADLTTRHHEVGFMFIIPLAVRTVTNHAVARGELKPKEVMQ